METVILIYEIQQIDPLIDFLTSSSEEEKKLLTVIALGADIEFLLAKRDVSFQSGRDLRRATHFGSLLSSEKIGREVLDDPSFSFFSYRDVSLVDVYKPVLQDYLLTLFYFIDVLSSLAEQYPQYKQILLFSFTYIPLETDGILAPLEAHAAVDAARLIEKKYGLKVHIPTFETRATLVRARINIFLSAVRSIFLNVAFSVLNRIVLIVTPKKDIRLLATDYWRNVSPLMNQLPEAELLLLDRGESRRAGWVAIWKNRMRFIHIQSFISRAGSRKARAYIAASLVEWRQRQSSNEALRSAEFCGFSLTEMLLVALQEILDRGGKRAVNFIDGSYALYEHMHPDVVLVRASYSTQIHFPILCYVARILGIPSLEVQHGLIYLATRSTDQKPPVEYIATYGPRTSDEFKRFGYTDETLFKVGSPRFDAYQAIHDTKSPKKSFTIACIVPAILPQSWSDSYEVSNYLESMATAVAGIPNVHVLLKLRPDPHNEEFYRSVIARTFASVPHTIAQYEPLVEVFEKSDAIVTIYSTTVLEALISGRPVLYNGTLEFHRELGKELEGYVAAGALLMAHTQEELTHSLEALTRDPELCKTLVEKANAFMAENYSFDGKASQKLAKVVRFLAHKKSETFPL